jgi:Fe-S-cluster-containing dehydrogenase component
MAEGFILDLNRCTGCHACRLACTIENHLEPDASWRQIFTFNEFHHPAIPSFHLSIACNHCRDAPCLAACPARAISRDPATDAVLIDAQRCIGCSYCSWVCPYDAPRYSTAAGTMSKCTFCNHRLIEAMEPACVVVCPTGALRYEGLEAPGLVKSVRGFPDRPIEPGIRFVPLNRAPQQPVCTARPENARGSDSHLLTGEPESPISAKREWPLAVFTLLAGLLVGALAGSIVSGTGPEPFPFLAGGAAGLGISSLHLGKKIRAWRGIWNVRSSWLSREVLCFLVFLVLSAVVLLFAQGGIELRVTTAIVGLMGLISMDKVYGFTTNRVPTSLHSAGVLLTGLFFAALFAAHTFAALLIGLLKLGLYLGRKLLIRRDRTPVEWWISVVRIGSLATALLWLGTGLAGKGAVIGLALAGEFIDRLEYYEEMDVLSPRSQIREDLGVLCGG